MLRKYAIVNGAIVPSEDEDAKVLVYVNPDKNEIAYLTSTFNLDEHTLNSSFDPDEISRLEFETDHFAVIFKRPRNYSSEEQFLFKVSSIGAFLFKEHVIVLISEDVPLFDGKQTGKAQTVLDVLLKLLNRTIVHYLQHLRVINMISDEIEQKVNTSMENKFLIHMFTLEKSLVYYLNAINSNAMVIEKLRNSATRIGFTQENIELLEDIMIENGQCLKQTEIYSNIISSLMDARASIVSNNLNVMMKNLNAIVIAVAIPSFFASMGGMSEFSAMMQKYPLYISYPMFLLTMLIIGLGTFLLIKRWERHWK